MGHCTIRIKRSMFKAHISHMALLSDVLTDTPEVLVLCVCPVAHCSARMCLHALLIALFQLLRVFRQRFHRTNIENLVLFC